MIGATIAQCGVDKQSSFHFRWSYQMPRTIGIPPVNREPPCFQHLKEMEQVPRIHKRKPLSVNEKIGILYGVYRGWGAGRVSRFCRISDRTVRRFRTSLHDRPLSVFDPPVVNRVGNGLFQCRLCGEPRNKRTQIQRHLRSHFIAHEIARNIGLRDMPESL